MSKLRFGKEWKEDILSIPKDEMLTLFKSVCIRLLITEKDLKDAKKEIDEYEKVIDEYEKVIKNNKKG
jgi:hypothetical protein